ncbi:GyrI-like domain-containing protein [Acholeplasma equirhinis]|uniref:GyrI-like domain-containing protein n=1 Tax=Acholeplasma equirhinis TaxID=555393 RepID=UPI00197AD275|nr:GyrI-like domain-containing protein [Acholeplasma equirhinis]MBN3490623.1 GyrI-like domain-containing protein [Acholeplasma equirhinis]
MILKKVYKDQYQPKQEPMIIEIPKINYLTVKGKGNPNSEQGDYAKAVELLYGVAYTLKMSEKGEYKIPNFETYVVPPLEGFWWIEGLKGVDYDRYDEFQFISLLRLPDFIRKEDVSWAIETINKKKKTKDYEKVQFFTYDERLCVQMLHVGPYQDEPKTVEIMHVYLKDKGYQVDISDERYHHEIYISDPRKTDSVSLKTVLRHPIKKN